MEIQKQSKREFIKLAIAIPVILLLGYLSIKNPAWAIYLIAAPIATALILLFIVIAYNLAKMIFYLSLSLLGWLITMSIPVCIALIMGRFLG